jgi:hypothetical protein
MIWLRRTVNKISSTPISVLRRKGKVYWLHTFSTIISIIKPFNSASRLDRKISSWEYSEVLGQRMWDALLHVVSLQPAGERQYRALCIYIPWGYLNIYWMSYRAEHMHRWKLVLRVWKQKLDWFETFYGTTTNIVPVEPLRNPVLLGLQFGVY